MAKKKTTKPQKTCGDCIHEHACAMWNIGTIHEMNATNCTNHETARESAAYLIGKMEAQQEVPVVRCEKCLFRSQYPDENGLYNCGGIQTEDGDCPMMVKPDFFCAYGERRADNATD